MAAFQLPQDADRIDWRLFQCGPIALYYRQEVVAEHGAWLREHGYVVHSFDCSNYGSEDGLLGDIHRAFGWPVYEKYNLDAFNDDLWDVDIPKDGGMAFVFLHFDSVWRKSPERCWHGLDIFTENSRVKMLEGNRLLILAQVDDQRTYLKPVGAREVMANFAEFGRGRSA